MDGTDTAIGPPTGSEDRWVKAFDGLCADVIALPAVAKGGCMKCCGRSDATDPLISMHGTGWAVWNGSKGCMQPDHYSIFEEMGKLGAT